MSLTECPGCRRLGFAKAGPCPDCERLSGAGGPGARADAEERAFGGRNNSLFTAMFLIALAALTFVVLRGM